MPGSFFESVASEAVAKNSICQLYFNGLPLGKYSKIGILLIERAGICLDERKYSHSFAYAACRPDCGGAEVSPVSG